MAIGNDNPKLFPVEFFRQELMDLFGRCEGATGPENIVSVAIALIDPRGRDHDIVFHREHDALPGNFRAGKVVCGLLLYEHFFGSAAVYLYTSSLSD